MSKQKEYKTRKDFVAYFLQNPVTKEPEYEIRIKADNASLKEFQNLLAAEKIPSRRIGLGMPALILLLEHDSIKEALGVLHSWYSNNKAKDVELTIVKPDASIENITDEHQIATLIGKM